MSGIFQGLTNPDGRVRSMSSAKVPGGAVQFRGMWVWGDRVVPYQADVGQPRVFHDGIAFDAVTGLLLVGDGSSVPANISMGGLRVGANGSVVAGAVTPDVIHQGVGLTYAGVLTIVPEGIPEGAVFYAPLTSDTAELVAAYPDNFTRASDGLYQNLSGTWEVAGPDIARFENGMLLMEPASTNVLWNSDAVVTQTRTLGSTGLWTISVRGPGSITSSNGTGTATGHGTATDGSDVTIDVTVAGTFTFTVAGTPDYGQVENQPAATSPIITQEASASRAIDALTWSDLATYFPQTEGMLYVYGQTCFDKEAIPAANISLVSVAESPLSVLYYSNTALKSYDGTIGLGLSWPSFVKNDMFSMLVRWGPTGSDTFDLGYQLNGGSWVWIVVPLPYDGAFTLGSVMHLLRLAALPWRMRDLTLYDENKGRAWVEENYP